MTIQCNHVMSVFGACGLATSLLTAWSTAAFAGGVAPVPVPLAGVTGPYGLAMAGVAYGSWRLVKYLRNRG